MTTINRRITTRAEVEAVRNEREGPTLDYKGDVDPAEWWELAKDVAAFANHLGGVLLVGAFEDKATRTPNIAGLDPARVADIKRAYENIARDRCRPSPVAVPHVIPWDNGKELLAVNVEAYAAALVGAQFYEPDKNGKPQGANAWQFPVRVDDDNVPLTPETMAMYMNAHVRRVLVLLHTIPEKDYDRVYITHTRKGFDSAHNTLVGNYVPEHVRLRDFSIETNAVHFWMKGTLHVAVPLDDVEAVWHDDQLSRWFIAVSGQLQTWISLRDDDGQTGERGLYLRARL